MYDLGGNEKVALITTNIATAPIERWKLSLERSRFGADDDTNFR